jgi:hypothetical protein
MFPHKDVIGVKITMKYIRAWNIRILPGFYLKYLLSVDVVTLKIRSENSSYGYG